MIIIKSDQANYFHDYISKLTKGVVFKLELGEAITCTEFCWFTDVQWLSSENLKTNLSLSRF